MMAVQLEPQRYVEATLCTADEGDTFVRRNGTLEKLEKIGVRVTKTLPVKSVNPTSLQDVELLVIMLADMRGGQAQHVARLARSQNIDCYELPHQTSSIAWQNLANYARAHGDPLPSSPPSEVKMNKLEPVATTNATPKDDTLAKLYEEEAEKIRVELHKVTDSRDKLAQEVGRLTNELHKAQTSVKIAGSKEIEEKIESLKKRAAEATAMRTEAEEKAHDLEMRVIDAEKRAREAERGIRERDEELQRWEALQAAVDASRRHGDRLAGVERTLHEATGALSRLSTDVARMIGMLGTRAANPAPTPTPSYTPPSQPPPPAPSPSPAPKEEPSRPSINSQKFAQPSEVHHVIRRPPPAVAPPPPMPPPPPSSVSALTAAPSVVKASPPPAPKPPPPPPPAAEEEEDEEEEFDEADEETEEVEAAPVKAEKPLSPEALRMRERRARARLEKEQGRTPQRTGMSRSEAARVASRARWGNKRAAEKPAAVKPARSAPPPPSTPDNISLRNRALAHILMHPGVRSHDLERAFGFAPNDRDGARQIQGLLHGLRKAGKVEKRGLKPYRWYAV